MVKTPIQQAVLFATSTSTRRGREIPTALTRCGGVTLVKRALMVLSRNGVRRFVVVIADAEVRRATIADPQLASLEITWVFNAERPEDDAYSLWRARPHVRGEFFVAPCDRIFNPAVVKALIAEPLDAVTLAVGRAPMAALPAGEQAATLPADTHAVALVDTSANAGPVAGLGGRGDVWSTGIFVASRALFDALDRVDDHGQTRNLTQALDDLAARGAVRAADIGDGWWHPARNEFERKRAQSALVRSLRKSVDGIISRHINRRFSLAATRVLMHFPVRPNHVTAFSLMVSIAAAVTAAMATVASPGWLIVGAVLWQLASMLDGIDGELARLKFAESKFGEWFDTLTDDVGKFMFFIGSGVGFSAVTGQPIWLQICGVAVAIQLALSLSLYRKLLRTGSGSHYALKWDVNPNDPRLLMRLYARIEFLSRRDYYVFAWLVMAVSGLLHVAIVLTFATTLWALTHELVKPRQVRANFPAHPPG
ncbi:MAG: CDP-alcohol phosphatidyltransferase family protein [Myxococcales bacterium]|nr:CDP-alcohol phosphatidyltransferase family protein [Myxococcales bacterium]